MSIAIRRRLNFSGSKARQPDAGVHRSANARKQVFGIYDAKLEKWPLPFDELVVPTRYGRTHVIASGSPAAKPLVLVHPAGCAAFIWRKMIAALSEGHRTYALDTIGDVGKSVLADVRRYPKSGSDYGAWLTDVFDELKIGT